MARLFLTLLGGFRARLDTDQTASIAIRKSQALLAYLALPLGQAHSRDKLAALLWGDMRDAQARASLRQTLFTLRKVVGDPQPLRVSGEIVALDPALVAVDVDAFEQRIARGTRESLEEAASLYRGDLLDGLVVQEAPFEDWLNGQRVRLREHAIDALARLLAQQQDAGALNDAVQTALRLVGLDPFQEPVHRALMRLYSRLNRREAALRQYQLCAAALRRELRAEPDPETTALYQQILQRQARSGSDAPAHAVAPSPATDLVPHADALASEIPLVGRAVELARLQDALEAALAGHGQIALVTGEPGIGKSRLVAELVAECRRKGGRLLLARSYETEQVLPFGPWISMLRTTGIARDRQMLDRLGPVWRAELARLLPEIAPGASPGTPTSDPAQLFEAVAQLLERLASAQPTMLVFEDLHWADEMSLRLLAFAGRRLQRLRLLAVATVRDENLLEPALLRHTVEELGRARRLGRVSLGALSRDETVALARTLARGPATSQLDAWIWDTSHGNPFMIVETLRALRGGSLPADASALPLPEGVRDLIARRLERLGERHRRLLAAAAVVGRPFDFALLPRAADVGEAEAAEGVEELIRHRVLHDGADGLEFTHDRIREVVYGQLAPARRAVLHRRVAEALEAVHAGAVERHALALGTHYREGEAWGPAVVHLARAGVQASLRYAKRDAVSCYEHALSALAHLPETRQTREQAAELYFNLGHSLFSVGQFERARESFFEADALAVALDDRVRLARIHGGLTYLVASEGDLDTAMQSGLRALTIASSLGDLGLEVWSSVGLARVYAGQGSYRAALERLRWVAGALKDVPLDERFGRGSLMPSVACRAWLALCLGEIGDFPEAIAWGGEGVRIAEDMAGPLERAWAYYCLGCAHLERGDAQLALPLLEQAAPLCGGGRFPIYWPRVLAALGAAHTMTGRPDAAIPLLEQAAAEADAIRLAYAHPRTLIYTGEAHLAAGRPNDARRYAGHALDVARRQGARGDQARTLHLEGEIDSRAEPSNVESALAHCTAALALATELGMAPLRARCARMLEAMRMRHWLAR